MPEAAAGTRTRAGGRWSWRLAGGLLVAVGVINALFGVLSLATDLVLLATGVAGGLLAVGLVTAAAGVLVWRGSQLTTFVALTVFGLLLVVQAADAVQDGGAAAEGLAQSPLARFGLLTVLVLALGVAAWHLRAGTGGRRSPGRSV